MKHTLICALVVTALISCNSNNDSGSNGSSSDTSTNNTTKMSGDTSRAVPDSVTGSSGYISSGNNANGNENAGNMNNDTIPMGAGRNNTPDSIKAKVMKQKGDTASSSVKHHK